MHPSLRVINQLPLSELFDESGTLSYRRERDVYADDICELLRSEPARFVVAALGCKPEFICLTKTFDFWKTEVLPHLAGPEERLDRERFPGEYFYWATEWIGPDGPRIVLLEKCH